MNPARENIRRYDNLGCADNYSCGCNYLDSFGGLHIGLGDIDKVNDAQLALSTAGVGTSIGLAIAGATAAIPIVGPIIAGASLLIGQLFKPDISKINGANAVNQLTDQAQKNIDSWNSLTSAQKTTSVQQYYINNFQTIFAALQQTCQNSGVSDKTWVNNCVADRSPGGKYDWGPVYLNPIVNDPAVHPDTPLVQVSNDIASGNVNDLLTIAESHPFWIAAAAVGLYLLL